jgi:hypothetical protein
MDAVRNSSSTKGNVQNMVDVDTSSQVADKNRSARWMQLGILLRKREMYKIWWAFMIAEDNERDVEE